MLFMAILRAVKPKHCLLDRFCCFLFFKFFIFDNRFFFKTYKASRNVYHSNFEQSMKRTPEHFQNPSLATIFIGCITSVCDIKGQCRRRNESPTHRFRSHFASTIYIYILKKITYIVQIYLAI